jgi:hypothetical protein
MMDAHHHALLFIGWCGSLPDSFPDWPQTMILLISIFGVVMITGMCYCAWPYAFSNLGNFIDLH